MKNNKKYQKNACKPKAAFFTLNSHPLTHDVTCSKFQRYEKIYLIRNCQWNTLHKAKKRTFYFRMAPQVTKR